MEILTLKAQDRVDKGKGASKIDRANDLIPGVLYGANLETSHIVLPELIVTNLIRTAGEHSLIQLEIEDRKPQLSLIAEVQHHPVTDRILHIDFKAIEKGQVIEVPVPLEFVGEAVGASAEGLFMANVHQITVKATPTDMPPSIQVDITELTEDKAIHVRDIIVPEDVEIVDDPDLTVASIIKPKAIIEVEEEVEEEELEVEGVEEGEAVEGEEAEGEAETKKKEETEEA